MAEACIVSEQRSYYLVKPPFSVLEGLNFSPRRETVFTCTAHRSAKLAAGTNSWPIPLVSDKDNPKRTARHGLPGRPLPVFPKAVIMCRVAALSSLHQGDQGREDWAYHLRMPKAENYHPLASISLPVRKICSTREIGISSESRRISGGSYLQLIPRSKRQKALLFTATYDASGMRPSAVAG